MKSKFGPTDILFPVPAALIATGSFEQPNLLTVAWIGMMASDPPVLAISLRKNRHSLGMIRRQREFTVNIPPAEMYAETDFCGLVSGRTHNKFQDCGFTPARASVVKAPLVEQCPFNLECKVVQEATLGDWNVFFGEVVETHVDTIAVNPETAKIDISKLNPLVYCATVREYWSLGKRIGFGFKAGRQIAAKARRSGQPGILANR